MCPLDYGWKESSDGHYIPAWYEGARLPDTLFDGEESELGDHVMYDHDSDGGMEILDVDIDENMAEEKTWSDDSDSDYEED